MKRFFDIVFVVILSVFLIIPIIIILIFIKLSSPGPAIYWSKRIGRCNKIFNMPKFRSMKKDTPEVATDLLDNPKLWITPIGSFLRKTSLDELPQLWSILQGHMSFVGPRPALYNQDELKKMRTGLNIHRIRPGVTGLAQIEGRDEIPINQKVLLDKKYLDKQSLFLDLKIIIITLKKIVIRDGISH